MHSRGNPPPQWFYLSSYAQGSLSPFDMILKVHLEPLFLCTRIVLNPFLWDTLFVGLGRGYSFISAVQWTAEDTQQGLVFFQCPRLS